MMHCSKCGNKLPEDAKFCDRCGNQINPSSEESAPAGKTAPVTSQQFTPQQKKSLKLPLNLKWWQIGGIATWILFVGTIIVTVIGGGNKKEIPSGGYSDFDFSNSTNSSSSLINEDSSAAETESITSSQPASSQESISAEASSSAVPSIAESKASEFQDIPFDYNDISAAIKALHCYSGSGVACSHFADENNHIDEIKSSLSEDQKEWAMGAYKLDCCNSVAKAQAHYNKYFSTEFIKTHPFDANSLIERGGSLYCLEGAKGSVEYEFARPDLPIRRIAYNKLWVTVRRSTAVDDEYVAVYLEYQNGFYKITDVGK